MTYFVYSKRFIETAAFLVYKFYNEKQLSFLNDRYKYLSAMSIIVINKCSEIRSKCYKKLFLGCDVIS